ncbi:hypothetical protein [Nocardia terpenica]|uniref:Secreted protein n=1 Tax=Nocardia terpenica TaxID=455432 RepID=A0A6G9YYF4_9NOCA|nr:hypothetical protein [Nocardia terpenica]QIS18016.1 hypothetical protein F6W96_06585 [Nocardia terpenica]
MKHISEALTTAGAVLVLALGTAGIAHAVPGSPTDPGGTATGDFVYTTPNGGLQVLQNPEYGRCYRTITGVLSTTNDTDSTAQTFQNVDCTGTVVELPPKTSKNIEMFLSVRFERPA